MTLTDVLRTALAECGVPLLAIERQTGLKRASLSRFARGGQSLRLDMADKLAEFLQLELRKIPAPRRSDRKSTSRGN
jgi:transcriptional regulator with XRE-family HTH domain